jgi:hypothetical protein
MYGVGKWFFTLAKLMGFALHCNFFFFGFPRNIKLSSFTLFWITRPMIGLDE